MIPQSPPPQPLVRATNVYRISIALLVVTGGVFGFLFGKNFMNAQNALAQSQTLAARIGAEHEAAKPLQDELSKAFEPSRAVLRETVFAILPPDERYIELTKALDAFFDENYKVGSEIVVSNLRFGTPARVEDESYAALPLSMTITAASDKFYKFLDFVENSGSFENGLRLLDLRSIRMNFTQQSAQDEISFTVDLNAYFRTSSSNDGTLPATTTGTDGDTGSGASS